MPWLPTPWLPWASTCGAGRWRRKSHNFVGSPHFKFLITSFKWTLNTAWLAYCNPPIFSMHSLLSKYSAPSLLSSKILLPELHWKNKSWPKKTSPGSTVTSSHLLRYICALPPKALPSLHCSLFPFHLPCTWTLPPAFSSVSSIPS